MDRVLVIDDDVRLCELLLQYLQPEGFLVEIASNGATGLSRALSGEHSIVVLDVMLPDIQGFDVLRRIRAQSRIPVLMLTARGDEFDRILGLEIGADDYLPKPFNPRELAARLRAVLRRTTPGEAGVAVHTEKLTVGDVELDMGSRRVYRGGTEVSLTTVEFDLLNVMLRGAGQVLAREDLVKEVLCREFSPFDRSIDVHAGNLRRKLGPLADGSERIKGVRGAGYLYVLPMGARRP